MPLLKSGLKRWLKVKSIVLLGFLKPKVLPQIKTA
jgi:hypothetical protein